MPHSTKQDVVTRHTRFTSKADPDLILKSLNTAAEKMGGTGDAYQSEDTEEANLRLTFHTPKVQEFAGLASSGKRGGIDLHEGEEGVSLRSIHLQRVGGGGGGGGSVR